MPNRSDVLTALAFDFGVRQIGVAVGQTLSHTANPVTVLKARDGQPDWQQIESLIETWQPTILLVGLPLNMDGSESEFCLRARKFGRKLAGRYGMKTLMVDERLSTREAKHRGGPRQSYRREPVDGLAAQVILETWLGEPEAALPP